jgi:hypothetical protein
VEIKNKELSADYYKRKQHLMKKRLVFFFILVSSVSFLLFLSISEGWSLKILLSQNFSILTLFLILVLISLYLMVYNILLSRITLHICYHFENKKIPSLVIIVIFVFLYVFISFNTSEVKNIVPLGASKICIISLYFNFWTSQISETCMQMRLKIIPSFFLISLRAFFICRWVLIACWLLSAMGIALALVASDPIVQLGGWEGLILMATFYFLFKLFVRNPNAHSYKKKLNNFNKS